MWHSQLSLFYIFLKFNSDHEIQALGETLKSVESYASMYCMAALGCDGKEVGGTFGQCSISKPYLARYKYLVLVVKLKQRLSGGSAETQIYFLLIILNCQIQIQKYFIGFQMYGLSNNYQTGYLTSCGKKIYHNLINQSNVPKHF